MFGNVFLVHLSSCMNNAASSPLLRYYRERCPYPRCYRGVRHEV